MPAFLRALERGGPIDVPVAIVAAHPDDEVLALGSRLAGFRRLRIIHLTDGAPRDLADARRAGCADATSYAALRRTELRAALEAAEAAHADLRCYGYPDQETVLHAGEIAARLTDDLAETAAVFTHSYEHGHPDHDTAALGVALACDRLRAEARGAPLRLEFPSYNLRDGQPVYGRFWPDSTTPETAMLLTQAQRHRKLAALARHESQAAVIACFPIDPERVRPTPSYDFSAPPPPGEALYDRFGWRMTSREWRRRVRGLLGAEKEAGCP